MSDDGVVAEKRNRGRAPKLNDVCSVKTYIICTCIRQSLTKYIVNLQVNDKDSKETKKRGRPASKVPAKADKKIEKEGENGEPAAKRGRGRPKKGQTKAKVSYKQIL